MQQDREDIRKAILTKLFRNRVWGGRYVPVEKALSKVPKEDRHTAAEIVDELCKEGLLIEHKTGQCVSLNPRYKAEIEEELRDDLPDYYF